MKIGIGIITYNRPEFFLKCINSIRKGDVLVVVNDDPEHPYPVGFYNGATQVIQNTINQGVGQSKNIAISYLLKEKCTDFFILEDDIYLKDPDVFSRYITASEVTGIEHFLYLYHGPANKSTCGAPNPRLKVNYTSEVGIDLGQHCVGAFCYYTDNVLKEVGLMDDRYKNAAEHLDHTYLISKNNLTTPWWWFADIKDSWKYIDESACSEVNSTIRFRPDWQENIQKGWNLFKQKYGCFPTEISDVGQEAVVKWLKDTKPK